MECCPQLTVLLFHSTSLSGAFSSVFFVYLWTFFSKRSLFVRQRLPIEEDAFEFFKVEHTIAFDVMLSNHLINLIFLDFLTKFLHGEIDIFCRYFSRIVSIELTEDSAQFMFSEESSDVDGS